MADEGICHHGPHPPLQLRRWVPRPAAGCRQPSSSSSCSHHCHCHRMGPGPWHCSRCSPLLPPGWLGSARRGLCSPSALVRQADERGHILDVVGGELLQHLLIPYALVKCNHYRSIGDTRNGIVNLREPLDEGAQGFPWPLLDGVEIGLVTRPSLGALEVGHELAAQL
jgi:hypothetical protein